MVDVTVDVPASIRKVGSPGFILHRPRLVSQKERELQSWLDVHPSMQIRSIGLQYSPASQSLCTRQVGVQETKVAIAIANEKKGALDKVIVILE